MPRRIVRTPGRSRSAPAALLVALGWWGGLGCAHSVAAIEPPTPPPPAFSATGEDVLPERWWTVFEDDGLDALVSEALRGNLDLAAAWERLQAARAVVDRAHSDRLPDGALVADAEVAWPDTPERTEVFLGLAAEYEVDLWGRIGSAVDAERYRAQAGLEDYQTVALSLSAEVATTWLRVVELRRRLALLAEQIETNEKLLLVLESRFRRGLVRAVDVVRQEQLLEATRELAIGAAAEQQLAQHQLAVLLGRPPRADVAVARGELPAPPPLPATGLPSALVQRRPDVRRAHALLLAADRDMAAAVSARYPRFSLTATVGSVGSSASEVFTGWFVALAGNLVAPLFDPELEAEVDRTAAVKRQRLYEYGQTTLEAFREVEDAIIREQEQRERSESLLEQVALAEEAYRRLRVEYLHGVGDYLDVLTALTEEQELRRELLAAQGALLEFRVALYRALAGGFAAEREEAP